MLIDYIMLDCPLFVVPDWLLFILRVFVCVVFGLVVFGCVWLCLVWFVGC